METGFARSSHWKLAVEETENHDANCQHKRHSKLKLVNFFEAKYRKSGVARWQTSLLARLYLHGRPARFGRRARDALHVVGKGRRGGVRGARSA